MVVSNAHSQLDIEYDQADKGVHKDNGYQRAKHECHHAYDPNLRERELHLKVSSLVKAFVGLYGLCLSFGREQGRAATLFLVCCALDVPDETWNGDLKDREYHDD